MTGAGKESPPIQRIRQTADLDTLRVFVGLYGEHDLISDAGIARDLIYEHYVRTKIMDMAQYTVFGFNRPEKRYATSQRLLKRFDGKSEVWGHLLAIEQLGLLQAGHVPRRERPPICGAHYTALSGDVWAENAAEAAANLADELPGGFKHEAATYDYVIPVLNHYEERGRHPE